MMRHFHRWHDLYLLRVGFAIWFAVFWYMILTKMTLLIAIVAAQFRLQAFSETSYTKKRKSGNLTPVTKISEKLDVSDGS